MCIVYDPDGKSNLGSFDIIKRTQIGKTFYVCSEKECEFITWHLPYAISCPACDNPFLVEKKDSRGRTILQCPKAGCRYLRYPSGRLTTDSPLPTIPALKTRKVKKVLIKTKTGGGKPGRKVVRKVVRAKAR